MGSHNMLTITEAILQVFENHEDKFFWPLDNQRDAKLFVKLMHDIGMPYEDVGRQINELEDNFRAWRKGLGRVGIGARLMELINNSVGNVMDDDDDIMFNLQQLAKLKSKDKNGVSDVKADTRKTQPPQTLKVSETSGGDSGVSSASSVKTPSSSATTPQTPHQTSSPSSKATTPNTPVSEIRKSAPPIKQVLSPKADLTDAKIVSPVEAKPQMAKPVAATSGVEKRHSVNLEVKPAAVGTTVSTKSPEKSPVARHQASDADKRLSREVSKEKPKERAPASDDSDDDEQNKKRTQQKDPEVDEVRRKMDAIKKKVEMMKRMKAEQLAQHTASQSQQDEQEEEAETVPSDDKYEEMKKKLSERFEKIRDDSPKEEEAELPSHNGDELSDKETDEPQFEQSKRDVELVETQNDDDFNQNNGEETPPIIVSPAAPVLLRSQPARPEPAKLEPARPEPPSTLQFQAPVTEQKFLSPNRSSSGSTPSSASPTVGTPKKAVEEEMSSSSDDDEQLAVENYDSDLDPDNYDSDLDYSCHQQISNLRKNISKTKATVSATTPKGGPSGHIFVFTDSAPSESRRHRLKIGCSRRPECRLSQGRSYNLNLRQVSSAPVERQNQAIYGVRQALREFQILGTKNWYEGPVEVLLKITADAIEKFSTGGNLVGFKSGR